MAHLGRIRRGSSAVGRALLGGEVSGSVKNYRESSQVKSSQVKYREPVLQVRHCYCPLVCKKSHRHSLGTAQGWLRALGTGGEAMGSRACGARDAEVALVVLRVAAVLNHLGDGVAVGVVEVGERVDDVILTCGSLFLSFADNFTTL